MITMLKDWKGSVSVNDTDYTDIGRAISDFKPENDNIHIILHSNAKKSVTGAAGASEKVSDNTEYRFTVKAYMTRPASDEFDFMRKFNNDIPMPLRTMTGTIERETPKMYYCNLHGQGEPVITCMRCGRALTNPVSRHYGIGPECMSKLGFTCAIDDIDTIKKQLVNVTWSGWVIKSAILEQEKVVDNI